MTVRSFLISFLAVRSRQATFEQTHPGAWLVWEPGTWRAPSRDNPLQTQTGFAPSGAAATPSATGDALCFELGPAQAQRVLRVGRDPAKNEVVINDATVSREALVLTADGEQWLAQPALNRQVSLMGMALAPKQWTPLGPNYTLEVGDVRLTYYDGPVSLSGRLTR
jgi:hypothetical protein